MVPKWNDVISLLISATHTVLQAHGQENTEMYSGAFLYAPILQGLVESMVQSNHCPCLSEMHAFPKYFTYSFTLQKLPVGIRVSHATQQHVAGHATEQCA